MNETLKLERIERSRQAETIFAVGGTKKELTEMLVLQRKTDQKIFVGENISILIIETAPHKVRIGIDAPKDVAIVREEIARKNCRLSSKENKTD